MKVESFLEDVGLSILSSWEISLMTLIYEKKFFAFSFNHAITCHVLWLV